jgi:hypothetical protein
LLSAKASLEKIGVGDEGFTPHKVSTSPPLNLESYSRMTADITTYTAAGLALPGDLPALI